VIGESYQKVFAKRFASKDEQRAKGEEDQAGWNYIRGGKKKRVLL